MFKHFLFFTIILLVSNCSLKENKQVHGSKNLDIKKNEILVNVSNRNDIIKALGHPSTKSIFDTTVWIYIERINIENKIFSLKSSKVVKNDVLVLEFNKRGLLVKKNFYNKDDINQIDFSQSITEDIFSKRGFIYEFLSSMRQKINDPLGIRKKR